VSFRRIPCPYRFREMADNETEPMRIFNYANVRDYPTKLGSVAGDVFFVAFMLFLVWGMF
jgi:hypothetical protein